MYSVKIYDIKASANENYLILRSIDNSTFYWNDAKFLENKVDDYVFVVNKVSHEVLLTKLLRKGIQTQYSARTNTSRFMDGGKTFTVIGKFKRFIKFIILERNDISPDWNWTKRIGHSEIYDLWKENGKLIGETKRIEKINDLRQIFTSETAIKILNDCVDFINGTQQPNYVVGGASEQRVERYQEQSNSNGQPLKKKHLKNALLPFQEFVDIADKQTVGSGTTDDAGEFNRRNNKQTYSTLSVRISFGTGNAASIPWIAFLSFNQKVQEGIYPVLLYYKEQKLLVLSYGMSETKPPVVRWPNENSLTSIKNYFLSRHITKPYRYGDSFVFKTYSTAKRLDEPQIQSDLDDLISAYKSIFSPLPTAGYASIIDPIPTLPHMTEKKEKMRPIRSEGINYWWIMTNPVIWNFNDLKPGDLYDYNIRNEKNNKKLKAEYFEQLSKGDLMFGYENSPSRQIKIVFSVEKALHKTKRDVDVVSLKVLEKLDLPIHWSEFKNEPGLVDAEFVKDHQSNLLKFTEHEYLILLNIIDNKSIAQNKIDSSKAQTLYSFDSDKDKPFIETEAFKEIVLNLKIKKNLILQGPPGVGKTYLSRKIAKELIHHVYDHQIEMVQFHQSYGYEDFIQGLKPSATGGFELRNGIFYTFCQKAMLKPDKPFVLIIDEINRGNLNKIFGELLMLIERDKRGPEFSIRLANSEDEGDKFYVPANVYILGTLNTADRSLAALDYALYRRFAFVEIKSEFGRKFKAYLKSCGISNELTNHICDSITALNNTIGNDADLGKGFQIGHSYFCGYDKSQSEETWWQHIIEYELKPLLTEMWFDKPEHVSSLVKGLNYKL